ncbi:class I SAM-dependent methyltransferase [soil metagenome]
MALPNGTQRFSDRVDDYVRYRPTYPAALIDALMTKLDLERGKSIADLGSGTGISARLFIERGVNVFAVEPNEKMRRAAEKELAGASELHSVAGTAEATTLADHSVDAVVAFQAFHWFDHARARVEIARVVREPGPVALVWNERLVDTPFVRAYEELLHRLSPDYANVEHRNAYPSIDAFFAPTKPELVVMKSEQILNRDGLFGRAFSSSYVPKEGPAHEAFRAELGTLFDAHAMSGEVFFRYDTKAYIGRIG